MLFDLNPTIRINFGSSQIAAYLPNQDLSYCIDDLNTVPLLTRMQEMLPADRYEISEWLQSQNIESEPQEYFNSLVTAKILVVLSDSLPEKAGVKKWLERGWIDAFLYHVSCLLYTSPSPRDATLSRMPSSA